MTGVQHRFFTALLIPPVAYGSYVITGSHILAAFAGIGTATGMLLSPDLDLAENPKHALHYLFFVYGKLIHHRATLSHAPILGTVGRLLYLAFVLWPVWYFAGRPSINVNWNYALWAFIGLCVADVGHWICDFGTLEKRRRK